MGTNRKIRRRWDAMLFKGRKCLKAEGGVSEVQG